LILDWSDEALGSPIYFLGGGEMLRSKESCSKKLMSGSVSQIRPVSIHLLREFVRQEVTILVHGCKYIIEYNNLTKPTENTKNKALIDPLTKFEGSIFIVFGNSMTVFQVDFHTEPFLHFILVFLSMMSLQ
jgi:hypothetical protein